MSRSRALSRDLPDPDAGDISIRGPRPADGIDVPVASPVHDLQHQLQRLGDASVPYDYTEDERRASDKAPGWLRLSLPVAMSVVMWIGIFWASGVLRALGLAG